MTEMELHRYDDGRVRLTFRSPDTKGKQRESSVVFTSDGWGDLISAIARLEGGTDHVEVAR